MESLLIMLCKYATFNHQIYHYRTVGYIQYTNYLLITLKLFNSMTTLLVHLYNNSAINLALSTNNGSIYIKSKLNKLAVGDFAQGEAFYSWHYKFFWRAIPTVYTPTGIRF